MRQYICVQAGTTVPEVLALRNVRSHKIARVDRSVFWPKICTSFNSCGETRCLTKCCREDGGHAPALDTELQAVPNTSAGPAQCSNSASGHENDR